MKDTGIKIEHGVPLTKRYKHGAIADTIRQMKSGDSFLYRSNARSSVLSVSRRLKVRMTTRLVDANTVRVWRLE